MAANDPVSPPLVSIIVPARNEESSLADCLQSLVAQSGVAFEIIVVDDGSTDRTRAIAESFFAAQVIDPPPLPSGWTGKNNAVTAGARAARAEWLLFTDADTVHLPGSLSRALQEAKAHGAALLSYSPEQIVNSFWEKAVMPVIFAELAAAYRPSKVSDPASPAAAANGQYILVSREAYTAVGGHAAIAGSLLEDVALARAVKRSGRKIFFRYGADIVRTRMYRSFAQLREGWTKNLALLFPSPVRLAAMWASEFLLIVASAAISLAAATRQNWISALAVGILAATLYTFFLVRIRRANFRWDANILSLFGLPVAAGLVLKSWSGHRQGRITWKERSYQTANPQPAEGNRKTARQVS
ncbi:MAG TPA: glycosyltransferase family 2 protein [Candidatus Binatia bacterium]|nr:glycosyltransferase family 2 protein [Candidatus Binatia bacterium]